jgi:hypothetical protein
VKTFRLLRLIHNRFPARNSPIREVGLGRLRSEDGLAGRFFRLRKK